MNAWPYVGTPLAAGGADKPWLKIRQPNVIRPSVAADRDVMAASIISTVDQEAANARGTHLGKRDLLWPLHAPGFR